VRDEVTIERIEMDGDGGIEKTDRGYAVPVVLVIADGRRLPDRIGRRLLREAKEVVASLPQVPEHPTWAVFNERGLYVGMKVRFRIGGGR